MGLRYERVLIKLSGEALAPDAGRDILDPASLEEAAGQLIAVQREGVQLGAVVGGGNIWRGRGAGQIDRTTADSMGMLATCINALALRDTLERLGASAHVFSAFEMPRVAEVFTQRRALAVLEAGGIALFACGTGNPFFSTDTAVAVRAAELQVQAILMAKNIDGVYDADPRSNPDARRLERITYQRTLAMGLKVMDLPAVALCMETGIPLHVFGLREKDAMLRILRGEELGTLVTNGS